jgi:signal peptidase II
MNIRKFLGGHPESRRIYFFFLIAIAVFVIDHILKIFAFQQKCFVFCFNAVINKGAAFSLLSGLSWGRILFIIVAVVVLVSVVFAYFRFSRNSVLLRWALTLIFGGTLSNLLDRIVWGYVVDYIPFFNFSGLTFNLADLANSIGVLLLIVFLLKKKN